MARFMISMPDEMVKKIDRKAQEENRTRSEFLREAVRHHLGTTEASVSVPVKKKTTNRRRRLTKKGLEQQLIVKGLAQKGCPGLDLLLGPTQGPVDMKRVLRITRKLSGLSRQLLEDREDRV